MDITELVDKRYQDRTPSEIAEAPVHAIRGVSAQDAKLLKQAFGIETVRDFANLTLVKSAQNIVELAERKSGDDERTKANDVPSSPIVLNRQGQPVLWLGQKDEEQEEARSEREGVIFTKPRTFHSVTRKDCHYILVFRKSEFSIEVDAKITFGTVFSTDVVTEVQVKTELEKLLKSELTTEIKAELQVTYGISTTTLTQIGKMTNEQIERLVQTMTTTTTTIVTVYTIPISGTITYQEVWNVEEHWNWVGNDCGDLVLPEPEVIKSKATGYPVTYKINQAIVIREMHSPSVNARGNEWAKRQAEETANRLISRHVFLPDLPPATGVPTPLNIP